MTLRQRIMEALDKGPMTTRDLSQAIRISEKEVIAHLSHVVKSIRLPKRFIIEPPVCHGCEFVFTHRDRFTSPSRCPKCRHEGISPPVFRIEETADRN